MHAMLSRHWIARFWAWWTVELRAMVPAFLRQRLDGQAQAATWLRIAPDGLTLGSVRKGRLVCRPLELPLRKDAGAAPSSSGSIRLDPALVFETTLTFPLRADANLRQIVSHHLGLVIPMEPEALAFDHAVVKRDPGAQTLIVAVAVTKRTTLDRACEAARQAGFSPAEAVIDRAGEIDSRFDLMRHERRTPVSTGRNLRFRTMEVAAAVLIMATMGIQVHRIDQDQDQLASRIALRRTEADAVMQLQRKAAQLAESVAVLQARLGAPSQLTILGDVTRLLPDETWITFFHVQDQNVELIGYSKHAADLIGLFEQSANFQTPRFQSPVTTNPDGSEHFHLVVAVRRAAS